MSEGLPVYGFPFDPTLLKDKEFKASLAVSSRLVEVSFPSQRVPQLKLITESFVLKTGRLNAQNMEIVKPIGKALADIFKEIPKGETRDVPVITLTPSAKHFAVLMYDWENPTTFKKLADGWYREWAETQFVDFFE